MSLASSTSSKTTPVCEPVLTHGMETLPTTSAKVVMVLVPSAMELVIPTAMNAQAATIWYMARIHAIPHALLDNTQFLHPICVCLAIPTA